MKSFTFLLFFFHVFLSFGQPNSNYPPKINLRGSNLVEFIPANWTLLDSTSGDLNLDGYDDLAFVIQSKDSVTIHTHFEQQGEEIVVNDRTEKFKSRILLIAFRDQINNNFNLIEQSNSIILSHIDSSMNEPFQDIKIDSAQLILQYEASKNLGSWSQSNSTYKFNYIDTAFYLINVHKFTFNRAHPDFEEYFFDFLNKYWLVTKGNMNDGQKPKTVRKEFDSIQLKTIKTFGKPYLWNIVEDIFI